MENKTVVDHCPQCKGTLLLPMRGSVCNCNGREHNISVYKNKATKCMFTSADGVYCGNSRCDFKMIFRCPLSLELLPFE